MINTKLTYLQRTNYQPLLFQRLSLLCLLLCTTLLIQAQTRDSSTSLDSIITTADSLTTNDSLNGDSISFSIANHKSDLDAPVEYQAEDSIVMDLPNKKAYLFGKAQIVFQDITLIADYIEIDFDSKDVFATGTKDDSSGNYVGRPSFDDKGKIYEADTMKYNFETKKGISFGVLTTEKDGYIHGERVLRDSLENIYVKDAKFTTCNLPDPHFHIKADKIKVIPRKQIVTGPANLVIEDISTPLFVPFGFFPIPEKRKKGIIFPTFGESAAFGFNIRNLGYYLPVNDYIDLQLSTDVYFRGSWRAALNARYNRRYKYSGNLSLETSRFRRGEPEDPSFQITSDYKVNWRYRRDNKAKPGTTFGANVNFFTSSFLENNSTNFDDVISTNSNSSINYSKSLFNRNLNLAVTSNMSQNLGTGSLNLTLPQLTANVSRQLPFKNFNSDNKTLKSFMRNLGLSYTGTFKNEINTGDSTLVGSVGELFDGNLSVNAEQLADDFRNGVSHTIPIATSFKALKWVTVSPSFNFSEYWYFRTTEKTWDDTRDTLLVNNNVGGFERAYSYGTSIGLSTIIYGRKYFKGDGKLRAVSHVVRPNVSAVWNPDFNTGEENGYREYIDSSGEAQSYSIFENGLLGRPTRGPTAGLNFGVGNNLEIKVKSKKDTANGGIKKVKIIENLNIRSGYNFLQQDAYYLSNVVLSGNTTILEKIRMTFGATLDPYSWQLDSNNNPERFNELAWISEQKIGYLRAANLSFSASLNPDAFKRKENENVNQEELEFVNNNIEHYVDFSIPWDLRFTYNIRTSRTPLQENTIQQAITFSGNINLTDNWKISLNSGYDFLNKKLTFTTIDLNRDLHCWQMTFRWAPIGRQFFDFGIAVKSSTLQDLKLNRRRSWFDF